MTRKVIFLKVGDVSPWIVPDDWNNDDNKVHCIGAGAGGWQRGVAGGGYSMVANLALGIGVLIEFSVGVGGARGTIHDTPGDSGGDTWFNGTAIDDASVSAQGAQATDSDSAPGGAAANGIGDLKYSGGAGGAGLGGGGGGAGGPDGDGGAGGGGTFGGGAPDTYPVGGTANGPVGPDGAVVGENGRAGALWLSTETGDAAGPGSGGSGGYFGLSDNSAGSGGLFGGGGAGAGAGFTYHAGAGADGLIVIDYEPLPQATVVANMPDATVKALG